MAEAENENIYGLPPDELVGPYPDAKQFSPLVPGALDLAEAAPGSLNGLTMLAPPGTLERRYALAQALRALAPRAKLVALAPKDKGGSRIAGDLKRLGCVFEETARRHHRLCVAIGPGEAQAIADALAEGGPRLVAGLGLWSQPGAFSWDRVDPGSALLLAHLPALSGTGADFGCGVGVLARAALSAPGVTGLTLVDVDRRAVAMARRNVVDPRAAFAWADVGKEPVPSDLDFVVMNPPFHEGGIENQALGQSFIARAALALRSGGALWLVANRHLPYEAILKPHFRRVGMVAEAGGYKVCRALK